MNIGEIQSVGLSACTYNNYLAGANDFSRANYFSGIHYLAGGNYLTNANYVSPYIYSNTVSFQKVVENILKDYAETDAAKEDTEGQINASAAEERTQEQKLRDLLEQIENESKQNQRFQTDTSWWELRAERSESLKEQSEQYFLKTQDERRWERQQARKQERDMLKEEYRQVWRYV